MNTKNWFGTTSVFSKANFGLSKYDQCIVESGYLLRSFTTPSPPIGYEKLIFLFKSKEYPYYTYFATSIIGQWHDIICTISS